MPVLREDMSEIIISIIYFQARKFFSNLRNFNTIFITYNKKTRRQVKSEPFLAWSAMKYTRFKMYKVFLVNLNKSTHPSGQPYTTIYSCVRGRGGNLNPEHGSTTICGPIQSLWNVNKYYLLYGQRDSFVLKRQCHKIVDPF